MTPFEQAVAEARHKYDRIQQDIGFDPGDPRLMADGTFKEADRLFAELVAHLRRMHYQEAATALEEEAMRRDGGSEAQCSDKGYVWVEAASFLRGIE